MIHDSLPDVATAAQALPDGPARDLAAMVLARAEFTAADESCRVVPMPPNAWTRWVSALDNYRDACERVAAGAGALVLALDGLIVTRLEVISALDAWEAAGSEASRRRLDWAHDRWIDAAVRLSGQAASI